MAYLSKKPLIGLMSDPSMFFLEDNGFTNIESVSHLSVWSNMGITLYLPLDTIVMEYKTLFKMIYDGGYNQGRFDGSQDVKYKVRSKLDDLIFEDLKVN